MEEAIKKVEIKANIELCSDSLRIIRITNSGSAEAEHVEVEFFDDSESRVLDSYFPMRFLKPSEDGEILFDKGNYKSKILPIRIHWIDHNGMKDEMDKILEVMSDPDPSVWDNLEEED